MLIEPKKIIKGSCYKKRLEEKLLDNNLKLPIKCKIYAKSSQKKEYRSKKIEINNTMMGNSVERLKF